MNDGSTTTSLAHEHRDEEKTTKHDDPKPSKTATKPDSALYNKS